MKKDIRNLIAVLGFSLLTAVAITGWFLISSGPTGQYHANYVLLEPSLLGRLNYNDQNSKIGHSDRYVFDDMAYYFWDKNKQEWGTLQVDLPTYEKFYQLIARDYSIENPSQEVLGLFKTNPARLVIRVKTESSSNWQENIKEFQRIEFAENAPYYRIELHEDQSQPSWAYFHHANIYQESNTLFIP